MRRDGRHHEFMSYKPLYADDETDFLFLLCSVIGFGFLVPLSTAHLSFPY
jgi:hypothetical protein